jgi:bile acid-coenzyme A ligase
LRITGRAGEELPAGEIGDVYMRPDAGPGTTYRYIGAEAHRNTEGWEWIGDIGYCDADGYLYLADRRTDLIIAGGANIYPAEVEAAIDRFPGVRSSAVIGLPDEDMGARVHAIVDVPDGVSEDDLREHLLAHLVPYKVPRSFEFVNAPLRDEAGKVRRSALRDLWIQRNSATADNRVQGEAGDVTSR